MIQCSYLYVLFALINQRSVTSFEEYFLFLTHLISKWLETNIKTFKSTIKHFENLIIVIF